MTVAGMFFKYASEVYKDYKVNSDIIKLEQSIEELKAENEVLQDYLEYLDTDSYKEIVAKQDLNLRKEGEKVIVVKGSAYAEEVSFDENTIVYTNIPIYMKWWRMFFDIAT